MKHTISEIRGSIILALISLGDLGNNLNEAAEWNENGQKEEALLSLESVGVASDDAQRHLRAIGFKCEEVLLGKNKSPRTRKKKPAVAQ